MGLWRCVVTIFSAITVIVVVVVFVVAVLLCLCCSQKEDDKREEMAEFQRAGEAALLAMQEEKEVSQGIGDGYANFILFQHLKYSYSNSKCFVPMSEVQL